MKLGKSVLPDLMSIDKSVRSTKLYRVQIKSTAQIPLKLSAISGFSDHFAH